MPENAREGRENCWLNLTKYNIDDNNKIIKNMTSPAPTPDISIIPVDAENNPFLVWLVGMMACGKSTVANVLE